MADLHDLAARATEAQRRGATKTLHNLAGNLAAALPEALRRADERLHATVYERAAWHHDIGEHEGSEHPYQFCPRCEIEHPKGRLAEALRQLEQVRTELVKHVAAMWRAYAVVGFDTDGDETPDADTNFLRTFANAMEEHRRDYDDACNREAEALRQRDEALASLADEQDITAELARELADVERQRDEALAALQEVANWNARVAALHGSDGVREFAARRLAALSASREQGAEG